MFTNIYLPNNDQIIFGKAVSGLTNFGLSIGSLDGPILDWVQTSETLIESGSPDFPVFRTGVEAKSDQFSIPMNLLIDEPSAPPTLATPIYTSNTTLFAIVVFPELASNQFAVPRKSGVTELVLTINNHSPDFSYTFEGAPLTLVGTQITLLLIGQEKGEFSKEIVA